MALKSIYNLFLLCPMLNSLSFSVTEDFTLAICPGIGNTSESVYIRTFVHHATRQGGYRCAVLNHVGALTSVPVTAPRLFTYGELVLSMHIDEFALFSLVVVNRFRDKHRLLFRCCDIFSHFYFFKQVTRMTMTPCSSKSSRGGPTRKSSLSGSASEATWSLST